MNFVVNSFRFDLTPYFRQFGYEIDSDFAASMEHVGVMFSVIFIN